MNQAEHDKSIKTHEKHWNASQIGSLRSLPDAEVKFSIRITTSERIHSVTGPCAHKSLFANIIYIFAQIQSLRNAEEGAMANTFDQLQDS
jgi:hypothetical protein